MSKAEKPDKKPVESLYYEKVLPRLGDVLDWTREGADLKEISELLGVSYSAFRGWLKRGKEGEERYEPLAAIIAQGQEKPNREVEAALYKRAIGYTTTDTVEEVRQNGEGEVTGTVTKHVTREIPPDPTSILFLLRNRMPERWRKDPELTRKEAEGETGIIQLAPVEREEPGNG